MFIYPDYDQLKMVIFMINNKPPTHHIKGIG